MFQYDFLPSASHLASTFDCVVSCVLADSSTVHSLDTLAELARVLKPGGKLILDEAVTGERNLSIPAHKKLESTDWYHSFTMFLCRNDCPVTRDDPLEFN